MVIHWPLSKVTQIQHFQASLPQKPLGCLKPNFIWSLNGMLGWKFVQMFRVTWPRLFPNPYGKNQKSPSLEPRGRWHWNLVYSIRYSGTTRIIQMMTLGWPWPFLWQIYFPMLLHGWKLIQHIVIYFQACSYPAYSMHLGEWYRAMGLLATKNCWYLNLETERC